MENELANSPHNEPKYQHLSGAKLSQLRKLGHTEKEIQGFDEIAKSELETLLNNNILLKCGRRGYNEEIPFVYIFGFEKEGKTCVLRLLEDTYSVRGSHTRLQMKEIQESLALDMDGHQKQAIRWKIDEKNKAVFLLVINCAIHRGREYLSPVVQTLQDLGITGRNCLLVLSHARAGLRGSTLEQHFDNQLDDGGPISDLYRMLHPNIIAVEATDDSAYGRRCQREQILCHISRMVDVRNVKGYYGDNLLSSKEEALHSKVAPAFSIKTLRRLVGKCFQCRMLTCAICGIMVWVLIKLSQY